MPDAAPEPNPQPGPKPHPDASTTVPWQDQSRPLADRARAGASLPTGSSIPSGASPRNLGGRPEGEHRARVSSTGDTHIHPGYETGGHPWWRSYHKVDQEHPGEGHQEGTPESRKDTSKLHESVGLGKDGLGGSTSQRALAAGTPAETAQDKATRIAGNAGRAAGAVAVGLAKGLAVCGVDILSKGMAGMRAAMRAMLSPNPMSAAGTILTESLRGVGDTAESVAAVARRYGGEGSFESKLLGGIVTSEQAAVKRGAANGASVISQAIADSYAGSGLSEEEMASDISQLSPERLRSVYDSIDRRAAELVRELGEDSQRPKDDRMGRRERLERLEELRTLNGAVSEIGQRAKYDASVASDYAARLRREKADRRALNAGLRRMQQAEDERIAQEEFSRLDAGGRLARTVMGRNVRLNREGIATTATQRRAQRNRCEDYAREIRSALASEDPPSPDEEVVKGSGIYYTEEHARELEAKVRRIEEIEDGIEEEATRRRAAKAAARRDNRSSALIGVLDGHNLLYSEKNVDRFGIPRGLKNNASLARDLTAAMARYEEEMPLDAAGMDPEYLRLRAYRDGCRNNRLYQSLADQLGRLTDADLAELGTTREEMDRSLSKLASMCDAANEGLGLWDASKVRYEDWMPNAEPDPALQDDYQAYGEELVKRFNLKRPSGRSPKKERKKDEAGDAGGGAGGGGGDGAAPRRKVYVPYRPRTGGPDPEPEPDGYLRGQDWTERPGAGATDTSGGAPEGAPSPVPRGSPSPVYDDADGWDDGYNGDATFAYDGRDPTYLGYDTTDTSYVNMDDGMEEIADMAARYGVDTSAPIWEVVDQVSQKAADADDMRTLSRITGLMTAMMQREVGRSDGAGLLGGRSVIPYEGEDRSSEYAAWDELRGSGKGRGNSVMNTLGSAMNVPGSRAERGGRYKVSPEDIQALIRNNRGVLGDMVEAYRSRGYKGLEGLDRSLNASNQNIYDLLNRWGVDTSGMHVDDMYPALYREAARRGSAEGMDLAVRTSNLMNVRDAYAQDMSAAAEERMIREGREISPYEWTPRGAAQQASVPQGNVIYMRDAQGREIPMMVVPAGAYQQGAYGGAPYGVSQQEGPQGSVVERQLGDWRGERTAEDWADVYADQQLSKLFAATDIPEKSIPDDVEGKVRMLRAHDPALGKRATKVLEDWHGLRSDKLTINRGGYIVPKGRPGSAPADAPRIEGYTPPGEEDLPRFLTPEGRKSNRREGARDYVLTRNEQRYAAKVYQEYVGQGIPRDQAQVLAEQALDNARMRQSYERVRGDLLKANYLEFAERQGIDVPDDYAAPDAKARDLYAYLVNKLPTGGKEALRRLDPSDSEVKGILERVMSPSTLRIDGRLYQAYLKGDDLPAISAGTVGGAKAKTYSERQANQRRARDEAAGKETKRETTYTAEEGTYESPSDARPIGNVEYMPPSVDEPPVSDDISQEAPADVPTEAPETDEEAPKAPVRPDGGRTGKEALDERRRALKARKEQEREARRRSEEEPWTDDPEYRRHLDEGFSEEDALAMWVQAHPRWLREHPEAARLY